MYLCLLQFENNLLSFPELVVIVSKLIENVDTRGFSVTSFFLGCHSVFFKFSYYYYFEI